MLNPFKNLFHRNRLSSSGERSFCSYCKTELPGDSQFNYHPECKTLTDQFNSSLTNNADKVWLSWSDDLPEVSDHHLLERIPHGFRYNLDRAHLMEVTFNAETHSLVYHRVLKEIEFANPIHRLIYNFSGGILPVFDLKTKIFLVISGFISFYLLALVVQFLYTSIAQIFNISTYLAFIFLIIVFILLFIPSGLFFIRKVSEWNHESR